MARQTTNTSQRNARGGSNGHRQANGSIAEDGDRARNTYRRRYQREGAPPVHPRARERHPLDPTTTATTQAETSRQATHHPANETDRAPSTVMVPRVQQVGLSSTGVRTMVSATYDAGEVMKDEYPVQTASDNTPTENTDVKMAGGTQVSAIFCGTQPTQQTQSVASSGLASDMSQVSHSVAPTRAINMINKPLSKPMVNSNVHRNINNYKGKDPVKSAVTNPKLRAILSGKRKRTTKKQGGPVIQMGAKDVGPRAPPDSE